MPEPGVAPQPSIKKGSGPLALAQGDAAQVNELVGLVPPDRQDYQPQGDAQNFLFAPSDRPKEPFSQGLPFGPGASVVPGAGETDDQLVQRVANEALKDPAAPKQLKDFANRALNGM